MRGMAPQRAKVVTARRIRVALVPVPPHLSSFGTTYAASPGSIR